MAYTQADIDALDEALVSGVSTVRYRDRTVTYHSLKEMRALRRDMIREVDAAAGKKRPRTMRVFQSGRGY